MYHDERIIDGILHYRTMPRGPWHPYSVAQLTEMLRCEREFRALTEAKAEESRAIESRLFWAKVGQY